MYYSLLSNSAIARETENRSSISGLLTEFWIKESIIRFTELVVSAIRPGRCSRNIPYSEPALLFSSGFQTYVSHVFAATDRPRSR